MADPVKLDMSTSVPLSQPVKLDMSTSVPLDAPQHGPAYRFAAGAAGPTKSVTVGADYIGGGSQLPEASEQDVAAHQPLSSFFKQSSLANVPENAWQQLKAANPIAMSKFANGDIAGGLGETIANLYFLRNGIKSGAAGETARDLSPQLNGGLDAASNAIDAVKNVDKAKVLATAKLAAKPLAEEIPVVGTVMRAGRKIGEYKDAAGKIREIWMPAEEPTAPAAAGQVPTPQEAAPAVQQPEAAQPESAPQQQSPGANTRLPSESPLTGEQALRQILTGQDNANLMRIAKSRGINVTKESQLKPGIADKLLVNKIADDFSPEELDEVGAKYLENSRFGHNFGDIGSEAWKSMSMQTYFPDVKMPAAMLKRVQAAIAGAAPKTSQIPQQAMAQAAAANAPIPQELAQPGSIADALRASLAQRGIIVDANGNILKK